MSAVLVINSGSSSFKYQLIELDGEQTLASGIVERIGEAQGSSKHKNVEAETENRDESKPIPDHAAGFAAMLEAFAQHGPSFDEHPLIAVGHRVVHGGTEFDRAVVVDSDVEKSIDDLAALAPLHNPANLQGIRAAKDAFPEVTQVAVFDTAFHQSLEPAAYTYAIDAELAAKHQIRRYGFHGTSHKFVSEKTAEFLGRPLAELKIIVLHIGNGASVTAVAGGRSIDTSMGMTPLEGLVMGTRSGDLDPAVLFHLHRAAGLDFDDLDTLLNKKSGMLGLTGTGDMRDVQDAALHGDDAARAALAVNSHRIRHYIGAYAAQLGGVDAVVFTAGVGENDAPLRRLSLEGLEFLGITLDDEKNELRSREARSLARDGAPVAVLVIPTDEELEIARQAAALV